MAFMEPLLDALSVHSALSFFLVLDPFIFIPARGGIYLQSILRRVVPCKMFEGLAAKDVPIGMYLTHM